MRRARGGEDLLRMRFPTLDELWRSVARVFSTELDPLLGWAALIVALFLGVFTNGLYEGFKTIGERLLGPEWGAVIVLLLALVVMLAAMVGVLLFRFFRLRGRGTVRLVESSPAPHVGLVYVLSLQIDTAMIAIKHHAPRLKHCWVIYTKGDSNLADVFNKLEVQVKDTGIEIEWHPVEIEADPTTHKAKSQAVYEAVRGVLTGDLPVGVSPEQIITDITGGTRPISAATTLACGILKGSLEYLDSDYDPVTNRRIPGTERLVSVEWE